MRERAARGCTKLSSMLSSFMRLLDDGQLIGRVVDDEVARQPDGGRLAPQQPCAQRVERRDPHPEQSPPSSAATRVRISSAALFVNVTASTPSGRQARETMCAMRWAMTRVLPEPAPARISTAPSVCSTASRCSGFSAERRSVKFGIRNAECGVKPERIGSRDDVTMSPSILSEPPPAIDIVERYSTVTLFARFRG